MSEEKYSEKLKDPRWQKFRLKIFERDHWQCMRCDCETKPLHAHHLKYIKKWNPWNYNYSDVVTLCEDCHNDAHGENSDDILKEICPTSYIDNFAEEIAYFNGLFKSVLSKKSDTEEHYCRCLRAYFIDSNLIFTTKKNIIKRIKHYYHFHIKKAITAKEYFSEDLKYLLLSQKYLTMDYICLTGSIEELIGQVIKKVSAEDRLYYCRGYNPDIKTYQEEMEDVFFEFFFDCLYHNDINDDNQIIIFPEILICKINKVKAEINDINKIQDIYLYNKDEWIEAFDCIDYTPPELKS